MLKDNKRFHKGKAAKWIGSMLLSIISFSFLFLCESTLLKTYAKQLDYIWEYAIRITPYIDGSLEMNYHIEWEVLDSTSEGPLKWVKIGIANEYIENLEALSDNIEKISYYEDDGDYVRLDLDRSYYEGEIV